LGLGWLAGRLWVLGLFALGMGLAVGFVAVFARTLFALRGRAIGMSALAILVGWAGSQWVEDHNHRAAFARDLARSRAADAHLDPAEMRRAFDEDPDAASAFLAKDADSLLARETLRLTGQTGSVGRWLQRHGAGLRLASAGSRLFGLDTGWVVSALAEILELSGAMLLSLRIGGFPFRRRRSRAQGP